MTDKILSTISGQFSRNLVFGTLLPVAIYFLWFQLLIFPMIPPDAWIRDQFVSLTSQEKVLEILAIVTILSGTLYIFNAMIIEWLQGYPWRHTWIGRKRCEYYRRNLEIVSAQREGLRTLYRKLTKDGAENAPDTLELVDARIDARDRSVNQDFPETMTSVLPTRLGNVCIAIETYSRQRYGISTTLWSRLSAVLDKDFATKMDEAKTLFDFHLNCSLLSAVVAIMSLITGLVFGYPLGVIDLSISWCTWTVLAGILAFAFYSGAVSQEKAWGEYYKAAFDLYRWRLLDQLGYKSLPPSASHERDLWRAISRQIIFGDRPGRSRSVANYSFSPITVHSEAAQLRLDVARGIKSSEAGIDCIYVRVDNLDQEKRTAKDVVVTDTLPDGYYYIWDSVGNSDRQIRVVGSNPYHFHLGAISAGDPVLFTYCIRKLSEKS